MVRARILGALLVVALASPRPVGISSRHLIFSRQLRSHRSGRLAAWGGGGKQGGTPLVDALRDVAGKVKAAFFVPGHKMGESCPLPLQKLWESPGLQTPSPNNPMRYDLTELPELDNLASPEGVILDAEALAAEAFKAKKTWFLVNGSTSGVIASIVAAVAQYRRNHPNTRSVKIILPRNVHKSAIEGLIVSGAEPVWITPKYNSRLGIYQDVPLEEISEAIRQHPDVGAVFLVSPTYHGIVSNIAEIGKICKSWNIPLLIDEAHGPHLSFLPYPYSNLSALSQGADVVVQSTHKYLSAFTQSAMLHMGNESLLGQESISRSIALAQSTSPSYLLMASLDAARWQMAVGDGVFRLNNTLHLCQQAMAQIDRIPGFQALRPHHLSPPPPTSPNSLISDESAALVPPLDSTGVPPLDSTGVPPLDSTGVPPLDPIVPPLDPTRITIFPSGENGEYWSGYDLAEALRTIGIYIEVASERYVILTPSLATRERDISYLLRGLSHVSKTLNNSKGTGGSILQEFRHSKGRMTPREAFFSPIKKVLADEAVGELSAETICPYPPGIPVLLPGEEITEAVISELRNVVESGGSVVGAEDTSLKSFLVIDH
ncbi:hypothetical protein AAMO2058_001504700 [Amorphochlora amoebiformis]